MSLFTRLNRVVKGFENAVLIVLIVALLSIGATQIILRNTTGGGFLWADELSKILVLWIALVGALVASHDGKQLKIDLIAHFVTDSWQKAFSVITDLFVVAVCSLLAWHGFRFVRDSRTFEDVVLGGFPAWIAQSIIPIAFAAIVLIHTLRALVDAVALLKLMKKR